MFFDKTSESDLIFKEFQTIFDKWFNKGKAYSITSDNDLDTFAAMKSFYAKHKDNSEFVKQVNALKKSFLSANILDPSDYFYARKIAEAQGNDDEADTLFKRENSSFGRMLGFR
jgi:hypothetical protein